jgi:uncharacterized protein
MSPDTTTMVVQGAGLLIIAGVLAQALAGALSAVRRLGHQSRQGLESLAWLRGQTELVLAQGRDERARAELSWNGFRKFEVARKVPEADNVHSFYLAPHDGKPLPPFRPGQYLTFQLKPPGADKPLVRCYSLSDGPLDRAVYRVSIKKCLPPRDAEGAPPGKSSSYFNDIVKEGDILDVKAPSGHFYLRMPPEKPVVLIAGGIGITPVLSMLNMICASESTVETWLFYGVANRDDHVAREHLREIDALHDNVRVLTFYSQPSDQDVQGRDYDFTGYVSIAKLREVLPSNNYTFYTCGPPLMMQAITKDLADWKVPKDDIRHESFGPASVPKPSASAPDGAADAAAVEVSFGRSGKTVIWTPGNGSLLDLAEANGIAIDFGCRAGNCGTCIVAVKSGQTEYLDEPGETPEEGSCLACLSIPKSNLALDA